MIALRRTRYGPFMVKTKERAFGELSGISLSHTGDAETMREGTDSLAYRKE
jgi:hypothetical protein